MFCYIGTVAGADAISAFADANDNGMLDAGSRLTQQRRLGSRERQKPSS